MQKKLMAIAVAGVLAAPVAMAQNVVLSGVADVAVEYQKTDSSGAIQGVNRLGLNTNTSYVRLSGTESLGGGLSAFFQIEAGANMEGRTAGSSAQTTGFGGRSTFAGLRGGFGEILIGSNSNPYADFGLSIIDVGGGRTATMGNLLLNGQTTGQSQNPGGLSATNCFGQTCNGAGATQFYRRSPVLQYSTPNIAGFTGKFSWELPENKNGQNSAGTATIYKPQVISTSGVYANGPLVVGLAYEEHQDLRANNDVAKGGLKDKAYLAGVSYNLGVARLGLAYSNVKFGDSATSVAGDDDQKTWAINGQIPVGAGTIEVAYSQQKTDDNGGRTDNDAKQWVVGYKHTLSKRTEVFATYSKITNQAKAAKVFWVNGLSGNDAAGTNTAVSAGQSPELFAVGIQHKF